MVIAWLLRATLALQLTGGALLGAWCASRVLHGGAWWLVPAGIAFSFVFHPLVIAIDFAITGAFRSPVPPAHRLDLVGGFRTYALEVAAGMRSFYWAQPFLGGTPAPAPENRCGAAPILFVHGYFCNRATWLPFMRAAAAAGHPCEAVTLEPTFGAIDGYLESVEEALRRLLSGVGAEHAVIVAHSMGGIVVRAWMRRFGSARVLRVITLGSPHAGTVMAAFGRGANVAQMRRDSVWLQELGAAESAATRAKITCLYSYHDNIVAPQLSATLAGARNLGLAGMGHVRLVYAPEVWALVLNEVRGAEVSQPGRRIADSTTPG